MFSSTTNLRLQFKGLAVGQFGIGIVLTPTVELGFSEITSRKYFDAERQLRDVEANADKAEGTPNVR